MKPLSQWDAGFNVHEAYHHQGLSQYDNLVLLPAETRNSQAPPHPIRHRLKCLSILLKSHAQQGF
ncbi:hypothetical protein EDD84_27180 [Burkholderia gladioli]|nr:hypothetical protein EDD84_27180 [Burkholderia gladioli]NBI49318.1 hypothetical protein [Burkholderia sp. ISTR5]